MQVPGLGLLLTARAVAVHVLARGREMAQGPGSPQLLGCKCVCDLVQANQAFASCCNQILQGALGISVLFLPADSRREDISQRTLEMICIFIELNSMFRCIRCTVPTELLTMLNFSLFFCFGDFNTKGKYQSDNSENCNLFIP